MRLIIKHVRLYGLLVRYFYLHVCKVYLHIKYYILMAAGAALVEAVKIEYFIKTLSKEDRLILTTCIVVSIYILALIMLIRV